MTPQAAIARAYPCSPRFRPDTELPPSFETYAVPPADELSGAFPADYGGGTIVSNDGRIVWSNADPTLKLDVYTYNSSVTPDPASPNGDGYYDKEVLREFDILLPQMQ